MEAWREGSVTSSLSPGFFFFFLTLMHNKSACTVWDFIVMSFDSQLGIIDTFC